MDLHTALVKRLPLEFLYKTSLFGEWKLTVFTKVYFCSFAETCLPPWMRYIIIHPQGGRVLSSYRHGSCSFRETLVISEAGSVFSFSRDVLGLGWSACLFVVFCILCCLYTWNSWPERKWAGVNEQEKPKGCQCLSPLSLLLHSKGLACMLIE